MSWKGWYLRCQEPEKTANLDASTSKTSKHYLLKSHVKATFISSIIITLLFHLPFTMIWQARLPWQSFNLECVILFTTHEPWGNEKKKSGRYNRWIESYHLVSWEQDRRGTLARLRPTTIQLIFDLSFSSGYQRLMWINLDSLMFGCVMLSWDLNQEPVAAAYP